MQLAGTTSWRMGTDEPQSFRAHGGGQRVWLETEVVRTVERGLGRKARPFELDIRVLPIASVQAWRLSSGRALVTGALFRDRACLRLNTLGR